METGTEGDGAHAGMSLGSRATACTRGHVDDQDQSNSKRHANQRRRWPTSFFQKNLFSEGEGANPAAGSQLPCEKNQCQCHQVDPSPKRKKREADEYKLTLIPLFKGNAAIY